MMHRASMLILSYWLRALECTQPRRRHTRACLPAHKCMRARAYACLRGAAHLHDAYVSRVQAGVLGHHHRPLQLMHRVAAWPLHAQVHLAGQGKPGQVRPLVLMVKIAGLGQPAEPPKHPT